MEILDDGKARNLMVKARESSLEIDGALVRSFNFLGGNFLREVSG